jgi:hypothetical protein
MLYPMPHAPKASAATRYPAAPLPATRKATCAGDQPTRTAKPIRMWACAGNNRGAGRWRQGNRCENTAGGRDGDSCGDGQVVDHHPVKVLLIGTSVMATATWIRPSWIRLRHVDL